MISTWHLDTSQVKDMDALLKTVQQFLTSANEKEPHVIHQVIFEGDE